MLSELQYVVILLVAVAAFAAEVVALVDAFRTPAGAFTAEGKLTRTKWLTILGVATLLGFLALPFPGAISPFNFLAIIATVAAIVYLVDVRPAVAPHRRRRGGSPRGW